MRRAGTTLVVGLATAASLLGCWGCGSTPLEPVLVAAEPGLTGLPARLDSLRVRLRIPGMAAALAVNGTLAWAGGFGLANAGTGVAAAPDTPFHLASLTKPFAATVLMQLVEGRLLAADSWTRVFTPTTSNAGDTLPYALGWYIQRLEGTTLQWHYGYWTTNSSLIVRVPERKMTFVVLANTSNLSAAFPGLGADDNVLRSEVAKLFVEAFVAGDEPLPAGGIGRP